MKKPLISVIIVYNNSQDTIENCINSIISQSIRNIEIILINNNSKDESENIVINLAKQDKRIICISLPVENELTSAVLKGIDIASGYYVCSVEADSVLEENYLEEKYSSVINFEKAELALKSGTLYKKSFVDNTLGIKELIRDSIVKENEIIKDKLSYFENYIKEEIDKCYKNCVENLGNRNYEITNRCDSLEKYVYSQVENYKKTNDGLKAEIYKYMEETKSAYNNQVSQIYDYINSEINQKGCELNKIYDEINTNYKYTEKITQEAKTESAQLIADEIKALNKQMEDFKEEVMLKYEALSTYTDVALESFENKINIIKSNIQANSIKSDFDFEESLNVKELEVLMKKNLEKIYKQMDENNSKFYQELTNMYKEVNQKFIAKK